MNCVYTQQSLSRVARDNPSFVAPIYAVMVVLRGAMRDTHRFLVFANFKGISQRQSPKEQVLRP